MKNKFELKIDGGKNADVFDLTVAAALRKVAAELAAGKSKGTVADGNGKAIGTWRLT